jgi:hypothetical protein
LQAWLRDLQFPIGIDPERFIQALETDKVKYHIKLLRSRFEGCKVMYSPEKKVLYKLEGYCKLCLLGIAKHVDIKT